MSTTQKFSRPKTRPAQRPLWLTVLLIFVVMLVLFGVGFGIATLFKGSGGADVADATGLSEDIPIRFGTILPNSRKQWILGAQPKIKDPVRFAELAKKTQNVRITNLR